MEALIENGFARVAEGDWLMGRSQPAAFSESVQIKFLKGFVVPDRAAIRSVSVVGNVWCADAEHPFLTRIDALPDDGEAPSEPLSVISSKILVAPFTSRKGARLLRPVPMTFRPSYPITELAGGWVVTATKSRVARIAVEDGKTFTVCPDALLAWCGKAPTGYCPKVGLMDLFLPRAPRNLQLRFHGPCVVWFEGVASKSRIHPGGAFRTGGVYA